MKKVGRNDPCPCGSGRKYKICCLVMNKDISEMYLEQLKITREIKGIEQCYKIIEIGKKILNLNNSDERLTGTYVNMAVAYRSIYFINSDAENLTLAQQCCRKALELKETNQVALRMMFGVCLDLKDYKNAAIALQQFSITDIKNPMCIQIIQEYQKIVQRENQGNYDDNIKKELDVLTEIILNKFDKNPGVCGVAMMYYIGIGNDSLKAYELGQRTVEAYPDSGVYTNLSLLCSSKIINRPIEAEEFAKKALELSKNNSEKVILEGNYFIALLRNEKLEEAENLMLKLLKENPCNQNFSNYAELLKRQGKYEEALSWAQKALFLIEDDTTLLIVADIYKRCSKYELAIEMYRKCFSCIQLNENAYNFKDFNGHMVASMCSNENLSEIMYEIFRGLLSACNAIKDYESAKTYLEIAKTRIPGKNDWEIWSETLCDIELNYNLYAETQKTLDECLMKNQQQKATIRNWALQLMQLQDDSATVDLDEEWSNYENKMNQIVQEMKNSINKEGIEYQNSINFVNSSYPRLDATAKEFLVTAEVLYAIHKTSIIDFAPVIVEYSKVVEKQLRVLLNTTLPPKCKMLGQIIGHIRQHAVMPYYNYLTDLEKINEKRKESAHVGVLTKADVDCIRSILFDNSLLSNLV